MKRLSLDLQRPLDGFGPADSYPIPDLRNGDAAGKLGSQDGQNHFT
jgi:hypothetical protein